MMRIGIVGAGFAGLSAGKVLGTFGHEYVIFEKCPDVGGVWSRTRRYPGLRTQNNKATYGFTDFPMPDEYPEWPTGEQVQAYLEAYADDFGVSEHVRLSTTVVSADLDEEAGRWTVTTEGPGGEREQHVFDHLVVANGIFCDTLVPDLPGREEHEAAGGRTCHASEAHSVDDVRDRHVVILGYGKSGCDLAAAVSDASASTTVVARKLLWKMPKRVANVLNYKYLFLTRMGEGLFRYIEPRGPERFLHGPGKPVRDALLGSVQAVATRQLHLKELGLVPHGSFEDIARSTVSLTTDGFYERVRTGGIAVHRDTVVDRLGADDAGRPIAVLTDGAEVGADLVVCATGFKQSVPFVSEDLQQRLTDERGNFALYRQILPHDIPNLTFSGYNSSFFSPLSAEVAALWIANLLMGGMRLPPVGERRRRVAERLRWMEQRSEGKHARGTNVIPFSMHNVDEMLDDISIDVSPSTRAMQWLLPIDPRSYRKVTEGLLERQRRLQGAQAPAAGVPAT